MTKRRELEAACLAAKQEDNSIVRQDVPEVISARSVQPIVPNVYQYQPQVAPHQYTPTAPQYMMQGYPSGTMSNIPNYLSVPTTNSLATTKLEVNQPTIHSQVSSSLSDRLVESQREISNAF